jgi:hypothetical protein
LRPKFHRDIFSGAALLLLAVTYALATRELPPGRGEPGPAFFPLILSAGLATLALGILIRALRGSESNGESVEPRHGLGKPLLAMGLTALYVVFFEKIGFFVSTWLYCLFVTWLLAERRRLLLLTVPLLCMLSLYLLFDIGLGIRLPFGVLE